MSQYYLPTASSARLYVHDVKGFLWAALGAVLLVDLPLALNQARLPAVGAACLTLLIVVPTFLLAYAVYGGARKQKQFSVASNEKEALELCLASLSELDDNFVTELDEKKGRVTAICNVGGSDLQLQFRVVPLASGCSHVYLSCQPVDPWKTIDFKNRSRVSLQLIQEFMKSMTEAGTEWDHAHSSNVQRHHICHRPTTASHQRSWAMIACFVLGGMLVMGVAALCQHHFATGSAKATDANTPACVSAVACVSNRTLLVAPGDNLDMPSGKRTQIGSLDGRIYREYDYLRSTLHDKGAVYAGLGKAGLARIQYEKAVHLKTLLFN